MKNKTLFLILLCCFSQILMIQAQTFEAANDTVNYEIFTGDTVLIDALKNDIIPSGASLSTSIKPFAKKGYASWYRNINLNKTYISYSPYPFFSGRDTIRYVLKINMPPVYDTGYIFINSIRDECTLHNIKQRCFISSKNFHFFPEQSLPKPNQIYLNNGDTFTSLFSHSLWVGAFDAIQQKFYLAAQTYGQKGRDFWTGPISNNYDANYHKKWRRTWKVSRWDINYHRNNYQNPGYVMHPSIAEWPGNGDVSQGQSAKIAPFVDLNSNGIYEPMLGDYPDVQGDFAVFFVYNDARYQHTESGGLPLGIEVRGYAFVYNYPNSNVYNNSIFFHTEIENKSQNTYNETMLSLFSDFDMGYAINDYAGCNVNKGYYYSYTPINYQDSLHPEPIQACILLAGPPLEPDLNDNYKYVVCSQFNNFLTSQDSINAFAINGFNFGDAIKDNERMGMTYFMTTSNSGNFLGITDPNQTPFFYSFMRTSRVRYDSINNKYIIFPLRYKGDSSAPACRYIYPGLSDSCDWGVMGKPYNVSKEWSMQSSNIQPYDFRGLGSTGPFKFRPGETVQLDYVFTFSEFCGSIPATFNCLDNIVDSIRSNYATIYTSIKENSPRTVDSDKEPNYKIVPNPVTNSFSIVPLIDNFLYEVYDFTGKLVCSGRASSSSISVSHLEKGYYIVRIFTEKTIQSLKFVKH